VTTPTPAPLPIGQARHRRGGAGLAFAIVRRGLCRLTLAGTGGLRVVGALPPTTCVLVANHASHADTVALLAALPARRRPIVAAAADYWFGRPGRAIVCRLMGGFPVRRSGGGCADLAAAADHLAAGHDVIVYPEGTRSRDGAIGEFHSGAQRLADRAGVDLVPVRITGTSTLLPVHGRLHPTRVSVLIGAPTRDLATARQALAQLAAAPAGYAHAERDSRIRRSIAAFACSSAGLVFVAAWALGEAVVLPLIPEFMLGVLILAAPRRAGVLALAAAAGSLAGGAMMYTLAAHTASPPRLLTTPRMYATASAQIASEGAAALRHQAMSGIPYKVYGLQAGRNHVGLSAFLWTSATARGVRTLIAGLVFGLVGAVLWRWRRWYPIVLTGYVLVFATGLAMVINAWS
jgi:1-acyl-sn-glycerol-3-phosphate acyltransferase